MNDQIWLYAARTSGLMAIAAVVCALGVAAMFVEPLHVRLPISLRLRLPTLLRAFAAISVGSMVARAAAFWVEPTFALNLTDVAVPTFNPGTEAASFPSVFLMGATVAAILSTVALAIYARSSSEDSEGRLDSPTAILEEMRKRLEELPTLPQFVPAAAEEPEPVAPFYEPEPAESAITIPLPERTPVAPSEQLESPPLPTDAVDPLTGEPDQDAYKAWLKDWLAFAENYGDEAVEDPARAGA